jgi:crotonobetainyl-CoA:carnitine CoA-transferase CaiB-like acyl-CoA transferase
MKNALEGIKVIDVSQVVAAPMCARHLADFGADVIHVENVMSGDFWRDYLTGVGAGSSVPSTVDYNWEVFNRNKKSVAINLKTGEGRRILHALVEKADIFITNLRLFERDKFACSYTHLQQVNPRIIYGSVTGFGSGGPERDAPAYDQTAHWYRSGVNYALVPGEAPDIGFRSGFGDTVAGLGLYGGIMTALFNRERTGKGQEVEVSLLETGLYQLSFDVAGALVAGKDFREMYAEQWNPEDPVHVEGLKLTTEAAMASKKVWEHWKQNAPNPLAGGYFTRDSRLIYMNILQPDRYWVNFCRAMSLGQLVKDPRFVNHEIRLENHKDLYFIIREAFATRDIKEVRQKLTENGIPFAVRQKISEVIHDPQARANNCFVKFDHPEHGPMEIPASPMTLSETPASYRLPAPRFGQHTEETLLALGYSREEIESFKEKKVIA